MSEFHCDPIAAYKERLYSDFVSVSENFFDDAVTRSGIDLAQNRRLASEIYRLLDEFCNADSKKSRLAALQWVLSIVVAVWGIVLFCMADQQKVPAWHVGAYLAVLALVLIVSFWKIIPRIRALRKQISALQAVTRAKSALAREKLAPLYEYFDWNTLPSFVSQVLPFLEFDDYLNANRLADMEMNFNQYLPRDDDSSLFAAESGTFYGYPFVLARFLNYHFVEKEWHGSLEISWLATEKDSNGKYHTVTRYQTLHASITRPAPDFYTDSFLFTGHPAVPSLNFSREPSELSGEEGFFANFSKKRVLKKLHRFAQNLEDSSNYTMMSNHDFEALFHCTDRSCEVGFRQLFTPLAQQMMLKLLNDKSCSFGDNFYYIKHGMGSCIIPHHLDDTRIASVPFRSGEFDFVKVKEQFRRESRDFFRSVYFTFAPLLTIPLYNEPRKKENIPEADGVSEAEVETAVNYVGGKFFAHPECITRNILLVRNFRTCGRFSAAEVYALGFKGINRVEYVSVLGGDGKWHNVPVEYVEYVSVTNVTTVLAAKEENAPEKNVLCRRRGIALWR